MHVRVGIFGAEGDLQCAAVAKELRALGAEDVLLRYDAFDLGMPLSVVEGRYLYRGHDVDDLEACYLRSIPAAYAPYVERHKDLVLFDDWFTHYMQARERATFYVAWLLALEQRGARLVNGPQAASVLQFKPFQLHALRAHGAPVPRTLISNDPQAIRAFHAELFGRVIFKPIMGGALTRALDAETLGQLEAVRHAPVIFQERVEGDDLRVMLVGDEVVSSVAIRTPEQHLDFRADPVYSQGGASYEPVTLPEQVIEQCRRAARECKLRFAGIDLKRTAAGDFVFLELNSSPIYLDVEHKLGHRISAAIARLLVGR